MVTSNHGNGNDWQPWYWLVVTHNHLERHVLIHIDPYCPLIRIIHIDSRFRFPAAVSDLSWTVRWFGRRLHLQEVPQSRTDSGQVQSGLVLVCCSSGSERLGHMATLIGCCCFGAHRPPYLRCGLSLVLFFFIGVGGECQPSPSSQLRTIDHRSITGGCNHRGYWSWSAGSSECSSVQRVRHYNVWCSIDWLID